MAQRVLAKLANATSGTATQVSINLPATSILPTTATATSGVSLASLDGLLVVAQTSGAVALTQGLTLIGNDVNSSVASGIVLVTFAIPTASTNAFSYFYGPSMGGGAGLGTLFSASGYIMDKMTIQATPGAASTVTLTVYGIRSAF